MDEQVAPGKKTSNMKRKHTEGGTRDR